MQRTEIGRDNLKYADDTHPYGRKQRRTKEPLNENEREKLKNWLKAHHSGNLRSWPPVPSLHGKQMGKQWKQWLTLLWGAPITADGDCSHEIKRCLLLGRKVMTNLDSILKSRDITLSTKVRLVKAMVFPVVTYGCESRTIKKPER